MDCGITTQGKIQTLGVCIFFFFFKSMQNRSLTTICAFGCQNVCVFNYQPAVQTGVFRFKAAIRCLNVGHLSQFALLHTFNPHISRSSLIDKYRGFK